MAITRSSATPSRSITSPKARRRARYELRPEDLLRADREARERKLDLIGIYHSHPDCDAYFSETDLKNSCPWYSFVVLSIQSATFDHANSWLPNRGADRCRKRGINMARIMIPTPLRQFADKHDTVDLPGKTVGEVLTALTARFPDLKKHLYTDEGKLRSFVNVYLNDEDIRYTGKDATPVNDPDTLSIVPSIAGGIHA